MYICPVCCILQKSKAYFVGNQVSLPHSYIHVLVDGRQYIFYCYRTKENTVNILCNDNPTDKVLFSSVFSDSNFYDGSDLYCTHNNLVLTREQVKDILHISDKYDFEVLYSYLLGIGFKESKDCL